MHPTRLLLICFGIGIIIFWLIVVGGSSHHILPSEYFNVYLPALIGVLIIIIGIILKKPR